MDLIPQNIIQKITFFFGSSNISRLLVLNKHWNTSIDQEDVWNFLTIIESSASDEIEEDDLVTEEDYMMFLEDEENEEEEDVFLVSKNSISTTKFSLEEEEEEEGCVPFFILDCAICIIRFFSDPVDFFSIVCSLPGLYERIKIHRCSFPNISFTLNRRGLENSVGEDKILFVSSLLSSSVLNLWILRLLEKRFINLKSIKYVIQGPDFHRNSARFSTNNKFHDEYLSSIKALWNLTTSFNIEIMNLSNLRILDLSFGLFGRVILKLENLPHLRELLIKNGKIERFDKILKNIEVLSSLGNTYVIQTEPNKTNIPFCQYISYDNIRNLKSLTIVERVFNLNKANPVERNTTNTFRGGVNLRIRGSQRRAKRRTADNFHFLNQILENHQNLRYFNLCLEGNLMSDIEISHPRIRVLELHHISISTMRNKSINSGNRKYRNKDIFSNHIFWICDMKKLSDIRILSPRITLGFRNIPMSRIQSLSTLDSCKFVISKYQNEINNNSEFVFAEVFPNLEYANFLKDEYRENTLFGGFRSLRHLCIPKLQKITPINGNKIERIDISYGGEFARLCHLPKLQEIRFEVHCSEENLKLGWREFSDKFIHLQTLQTLELRIKTDYFSLTLRSGLPKLERLSIFAIEGYYSVNNVVVENLPNLRTFKIDQTAEFIRLWKLKRLKRIEISRKPKKWEISTSIESIHLKVPLNWFVNGILEDSCFFDDENLESLSVSLSQIEEEKKKIRSCKILGKYLKIKFLELIMEESVMIRRLEIINFKNLLELVVYLKNSFEKYEEKKKVVIVDQDVGNLEMVRLIHAGNIDLISSKSLKSVKKNGVDYEDTGST